MKFSDKALSGIVAALLVAGVFVWVAWAQTMPAARSTSPLASTTLSADCPVCPASRASTTAKANIGNNTCLSLAGTAVYMDSPAVLLAKAEVIGLSDAQKHTLQDIVHQSRRDALAVLTVEQKGSLGEISPDPVVIGAILPQTQNAQTTACPADAACGGCPAAAAASSSACCLSEATQ